MRIDVEIDDRALRRKFEREGKALAYGAVQAINETAKDVQAAERANLDKKFTVRRAAFMYRLIKVKFASVAQQRPYAEIFVDPTKQRVILADFESGDVREPVKGQRVAVPITGSLARPSFTSPVADAFTFKALRFKRVTGAKGKAATFKGLMETYIIPAVGVFTRLGKTVSQLIYAFKRPMRMRKILGFFEVAEKTYKQRFKGNFDRAYRPSKD
jgi:hypothetical protein